MNIFQKTLIAVSAIVTFFTLLTYFIASAVLSGSYYQLEKAQAETSVRRTSNIFQNEVVALADTAQDWATWDDTYQFVQNPSEHYISSNLHNETFAILKISLFAITDTVGRVVFAKAYNLEEGKEEPIPKELAVHLREKDPIIARTRKGEKVAGILVLEGKPMMLASLPILRSDGSGPPRGSLVMARLLSEKVFKGVAEIAQSHLNLIPPKDINTLKLTPSDDKNLREGKIVVKTGSGGWLSAYAMMNDIYERPALILEVRLPRDIYWRGKLSRSYIVFSVLASGVLLGFCVMILLQRLVLNRVALLARRVKQMGEAGDLSSRVTVKGRDEISQLALELNRTLGKLETYQESLLESEARYRALFEEMPVGLCVHTETIEVANKELARILGLTSPSELQGKSLSAFFSGEERKRFLSEVMGKLSASFPVGPGEWKMENAEGKEFHVEVGGVPTMLGGKPAILFYLRDISELKEMRDIVLRIEKLEALGNLAASLSHSMNNVLTALLAHVEFLKGLISKKELAKQEALEKLEQMENFIMESARVPRTLLAFSRPGGTIKKPVSLNSIIIGSLEIIKASLTEKISLNLNLREGLPLVMGDATIIDNILLNLCLNAVDAMPSGGRLLISTEEVVLDETYALTHPDAEPGRYARLSVSDTGIGMSPEVLTHIFEPFFTTKPPGKGTGLGLFTVHSQVRQMEGHIHVYSEKGKGTTFSIYIPLAEKELAEEAELPLEALSGKETILFADDEEIILEAMVEILGSYGYKVLPAKDGEVALSIIRERQGDIDLAILDTVMPKVGGFEVYERVKFDYPHMRFLFSSGYEAQSEEVSFVTELGLNFIQKPYTPKELVQKVRSILGTGKRENQNSSAD